MWRELCHCHPVCTQRRCCYCSWTCIFTSLCFLFLSTKSSAQKFTTAELGIFSTANLSCDILLHSTDFFIIVLEVWHKRKLVLDLYTSKFYCKSHYTCWVLFLASKPYIMQIDDNLHFQIFISQWCFLFSCL